MAVNRITRFVDDNGDGELRLLELVPVV